MFLRIFARCLLCVGTSLASSAPDRPTSEMKTVVEQFREYYVGGKTGGALTLNGTNEEAADPRDAMRLAHSLNDDGHWADLDYQSTARSNWPQATHCSRVLALTGALYEQRINPADHAFLLAAIHRALKFWEQHDFICRNWWYNQIGIPKSLGAAGLLMGEALTPDEDHYLTAVLMPRGKIAMTGQNRVWLAGNTMMLGLLQHDSLLIDQASATIWDEIQVTENEGIQPDFSFHQHGPQQQFGNYGMAFAVEVCKWGQILRGTAWAMPAQKLTIYRNYLLEGQNWVSYRGSMDISSCGRQLMPRSPEAKTRAIVSVMQAAASFDPSRAADYLAFVPRNTKPAAENDLVGNRFFWRSDYLVHRRPDWCATLKMHSHRVIGGESINSENLSGYFLADGALYLYRSGNEYRDIFPVWDWRKLPGVTCPQSSDAPPQLTAASLKTDRTFVGGVSDGTCGCAAMDYARDGVTAHKAWFLSEDTLFCLGAGIRSSGDAPLATTINQCLLHGGFTTSVDNKQSHFATGKNEFDRLDWVEQDGWRYAFPEPCHVRMEALSRTGNWRRVFDTPATPAADITRDVFTLWIDHGKQPANAAYACAITSAGHSSEAKVLANNEELQAVQMDTHRVDMIFWKAGRIALAGIGELRVDQPCLVLLDIQTGRAIVSDPTQTLAALTVTFAGQSQQALLPAGPDAGRSIEVRFN